MPIRVAGVDDLANIVALLKEFHHESSFKDVPFSDRVIGENLTRALSADIACALVAEEGGSLVGFLLGHCTRYFFSESLAAWEEFVFVAPSARGTVVGRMLIRRFVAWARERGAAKVHLGINAGIDPRRSGLFVEKLGFERTGEVFALTFTDPG